jgi:hypothetical protein
MNHVPFCILPDKLKYLMDKGIEVVKTLGH